jgi:hypothetical protein
MFAHLNIHKYTWTSPDRKTHNQIDNILIDRSWHSSIMNVRNFRGADCDTQHNGMNSNEFNTKFDCDTDHRLVVAKVRERMALSKQTAQTFGGEIRI